MTTYFREQLPPFYRRLIIVVVVVLAVGLGFFAVRWYLDDGCGDDRLTRLGPADECIGLTDGSAKPFHPELADLQKKLVDQNKTARAAKAHVKVAFLRPITVTDRDSSVPYDVRKELEGAVAAQWRANEKLNQVKIELLIANTGSESRHWKKVIDQIAADSEIVAVAGLGPSTANAVRAIERLKKLKIPAVASVMTADALTDIDKGLVRVAPPNSRQAQALSGVIPALPSDKVLLVKDADPENIYAEDLAKQFLSNRKNSEVERITFRFDATSIKENPNPLRQFRNEICKRRPEYVFFAGRGKQLNALLRSFGIEPCSGLKVTIVSGDDSTNVTLDDDEVKDALTKGVTLKFAALAFPDAVSKLSETPGGYKEFLFAYETFGFNVYELEDGGAMMAYDAVLTAANAINNLQDLRKIRRGDVIGQWEWVEFDGASGPISFDPCTGNPKDKPCTGDPKNKIVPILQLTAKGKLKLVDVKR